MRINMGFVDGYFKQWGYLAWHGPRYAEQVQKLQQEQAAGVRINGDDNRVTINQQQTNVQDSPTSHGSGEGTDGGHILSRCSFLCSSIVIK